MTDKLNKSEKSSLYCNIDVSIRKTIGLIYSPYKDSDIRVIIEMLKNYYIKYNTYQSLLEKWEDKEVSKFINDAIKNMLDDRCTLKQLNYYKSLCVKYKLEDKGVMNRIKLSKRISSIIESDGEHQNCK